MRNAGSIKLYRQKVYSAFAFTGLAILANLSGTGHGFGCWIVVKAKLIIQTAITAPDKMIFLFIVFCF